MIQSVQYNVNGEGEDNGKLNKQYNDARGGILVKDSYKGLRLQSYDQEDSACAVKLGDVLPAWQSTLFNTNSFFEEDILKFNTLSNKKKNLEGKEISTPIFANTWNLAKMNSCTQLTDNGVNDETKSGVWGTGAECNDAVKYKQVYSPENLKKALEGPYNFNVTETQNAWATSMFYVGEKLPSLKQYADIEAKYSQETNYGGRYIQIRNTQKNKKCHSSLTSDFYITIQKFS